MEYWADYLNERGMALGVYYNPTWISPAAVKNKEILVKGTNIPVREITDLSYVYNGENEKKITGDRFSYPNGEDRALYWVDVDRSGAKEYVQGYVKYFIDCHVAFYELIFFPGTKMEWIKESRLAEIMDQQITEKFSNGSRKQQGIR